ncbi:MAG: hypothetical protein ACR2QE_17630 [Acidimicrobiales bacterium]
MAGGVRGIVITTAMAVVIGGCGGSDDDPVLVPPTTTVVASTTEAPPPRQQVQLTMVDQVPADAPALLLATPAGATRWTPGDGPVVVHEVDDELRHAVDDGAGGVVGLTVDEQLLGSVWWWPAAGERVLLRSQGGLALHDSTVRNESAAVVITYSPIDVTEPTQVLDLLDLATTSARTVATVGDATSAAVAAAASADAFVTTNIDADCSTITMFDDTGEPMTGRVLPTESCAPDGYGPLAIADTGERIVVATNTDDNRWGLLVADDGNDELVEYALPAVVEAITTIDVMDRYVVLSTGTGTYLVDLDADMVVDLGVVAGSVQVVADP